MGRGSERRNVFNTDRLMCSGTESVTTPPSDDDTTGLDIHPNVCVGGDAAATEAVQPGSSFIDTADGGQLHRVSQMRTGDYSMEWWVRRVHPDSITTWGANTGQSYGVWGMGDGTNQGPAAVRNGAGMCARGANIELFYGESSGVTYDALTITLPLGWHHVAGTWDRSGNLTGYVDGVSQGTVAIDTTDQGFCEPFFGVCDVDNADGPTTAPLIVAMAAHHLGLLTTAQIQASVDNLTVNTLGANTLFAVDMSGFRVIQGPGWDATDYTPGTGAATGAASMGVWIAATNGVLTNITIPTGAMSALTPIPTDSVQYITVLDAPYCYASTPDLNENNVSATGATLGGAIGLYGVLDTADAVENYCPGPYFGLDPSWPPHGGASGHGYA